MSSHPDQTSLATKDLSFSEKIALKNDLLIFGRWKGKPTAMECARFLFDKVISNFYWNSFSTLSQKESGIKARKMGQSCPFG